LTNRIDHDATKNDAEKQMESSMELISPDCVSRLDPIFGAMAAAAQIREDEHPQKRDLCLPGWAGEAKAEPAPACISRRIGGVET
jgi:hypothetical protein